MVPLELSNASILVFSWTRNSDDIEIEAFNEQGTFNYKSAKSDGLEIIDMLRSNGTASLVIENSVCKQLRVIVKVLTNELVNENELLNSGLSINLYKDGQILGILPSLGSGNF